MATTIYPTVPVARPADEPWLVGVADAMPLMGELKDRTLVQAIACASGAPGYLLDHQKSRRVGRGPRLT